MYAQEGYSYLAQLPELKRFLETDLFESAVLARDRLFADFVLLDYEVLAPKLFPNPRAALVESGVVDKHNILHSKTIPNGVRLTVGYFGSVLQIALNIRDRLAMTDNDAPQSTK